MKEPRPKLLIELAFCGALFGVGIYMLGHGLELVSDHDGLGFFYFIVGAIVCWANSDRISERWGKLW